MKRKSGSKNTPGGNSEKSIQAASEAADFHAERMTQKREVLATRELANKPQGNDEYEQGIAEDANFNTDRLIAEEAFQIAKRRDAEAGDTLSDWLQAEATVEGFAMVSLTERRNKAVNDRRSEARKDRRSSAP